MNTDHLKYLIEISKSSSLQQASEKLFVSPQALSKAMANLESELGLPLLVRSYSGVNLTVNGWWLVELSKKYLSAIEERQDSYLKYLHKIDQIPEGELNIAVADCGLDTSPIYTFIAQLAHNTPTLAVHIRNFAQSAVIAQLKNGEADIGLSYRIQYNQNYINDLDPSLLWIPFHSSTLYLMASKNLLPNPPKSISLKKALHYPLCQFGTDAESWKNIVNKLLPADADSPLLHHWGMFQAQIAEGYCATLTTIPEKATRPTNDVPNTTLIEIRDDIEVHFGYLRLSDDSALSLNATFFIRQLEDYLQRTNADGAYTE